MESRHSNCARSRRACFKFALNQHPQQLIPLGNCILAIDMLIGSEHSDTIGEYTRQVTALQGPTILYTGTDLEDAGVVSSRIYKVAAAVQGIKFMTINKLRNMTQWVQSTVLLIVVLHSFH